ncbi:MAG: hypothetical protein E5Y12_24395 [Mesorhizobium sp.]|nr:MAG: hypothetical protein E5Y12_24395 [Mesorhizobium sp.]
MGARPAVSRVQPRPKTFIKFLFLSTSRRLEPLWRSGPYSISSKTSDAVTNRGAARRFHVIANLLSSGRKVEKWKQGINAMDIVVLGIGILFFVLSFAYIKACDIL